MFSKIVVLALIYTCGVFGQSQPLKRQVGTTVVEKDEHVPAETGFAGAHHAAGSKYFQDIYVAQNKPEELEFGHVAETPSDWEQRFEKLNLDNLNRQGKVRWGDKHGGYGEHYWDYNHAGHGHDGAGEESQQNEEYANYEESKQSPTYLSENNNNGKLNNGRGKRQPENPDVEFVDNKARSLILDGNVQRHGGNYRREGDFRHKRSHDDVKFVYEPNKGIIVDTNTGIEYELKPIERNR